MRFKLLLEATAVEATANALVSTDTDSQEDLLELGKELATITTGRGSDLYSFISYGSKDALKLISCIQKMIQQVGANNLTPLLKLINTVDLKKISNSENFINFVALSQAYSKGTIDLKAEFLSNPSLYSRGISDFTYALGLLNIAHDPAALKKEFGDSENIKVADLYNGNRIKPSGILAKNSDDMSTLYGVESFWKRISGKQGKKEIKQNEYPEFKDFASAEKARASLIRINGVFKYNKDAKGEFKWEPVKQY